MPPLSTQHSALERAISILERDRLAVLDLNLARDLLRRVVEWEAAIKRCPAITDIIMGEHSMWAPLIRITVEDAALADPEQSQQEMEQSRCAA